jgi:hypothetical protein
MRTVVGADHDPGGELGACRVHGGGLAARGDLRERWKRYFKSKTATDGSGNLQEIAAGRGETGRHYRVAAIRSSGAESSQFCPSDELSATAARAADRFVREFYIKVSIERRGNRV